MSHFTVLVIGSNPEEQLAPYQENNMGDCPRQYMEFNSVEDEYKVTFAEQNKNQKFESVEEYRQAFEAYMDKVGDYRKDEETGMYGYWDNPNKKWDWYRLGGRWTGFFKLKSDANKEFAVTGRPGLLTPIAKEGYADTALKRDIDVVGMRAEAEKEAEIEYQKVQEVFPNGIPKIEISWEVICDSNGPYKSLNWSDRRDFYQNQVGVKAWKDALYAKADALDQKSDERSFYLFRDQSEFQCSKEQYIKRAGDSSIMTFAVLKDGKWFERGSMGWWGVVSDEKDTDKWIYEFSQLINDLPDDTLLSVYDCHI